MGTDQQFCLRWNNFHTNITSAFESLRDDEDFVDITLACESKQVKAHKMVLSACSPYFRSLLKGNPCQHPIVFLKDVTFANLVSILDFMYHGEVNVSHNELATFLKTAEALKVRGLAEDDKKKDSDCADVGSPGGGAAESFDPGSPRPDDTNDTGVSDSPPPARKKRRHSAASPHSHTEDTNETLLSDLKDTQVKNEPHDFDDHDLLGHTDIKPDVPDTNDRTFGPSDSVSISRSQAAMQQLQESFGSFLPNMNQNANFLSSHGPTADMNRQNFSLDPVQGVSHGISGLPGPSMPQGGSSQDGSQEMLQDRKRLKAHDLRPWTSEDSQHTFNGPSSHALLADHSPRVTRDSVQCVICGAMLCNKYVLKSHVRDKHSPRGSFPCEFCQRLYGSVNSLRVHISRVHRRHANPASQTSVPF